MNSQEILDGVELQMKEAIYFVEATSNEQHLIWKEYVDGHDSVRYKQHMGMWKTIGYIRDDISMPVSVSFALTSFDDRLVVFYEATSRYVDHTMIEEWIKENYPVKTHDDRVAITDASNFHNVWHEIQWINKNK